MTKAKIEPDRVLTNFLRSNITDVNSSRSNAFIFPDFPRIDNIGDSDFPRVGITIIDESGDYLGMYDDDSWETINFQIDIVAKKGLTYDVTTTDEAMGTMASTINTSRLTFTDVPSTVTNIKHAGSGYSTVAKVSTISDFGTPATLGSGTVQWAFSTGDLNFDSTDVASDDTEAITSTSVTTLEGKKLCQYLARKIVKAIKNNWRSDTTINGLLYPLKISNTPIPFDEDLGIFRQTVEYQFRAYNAGEGI